MKYTKDQRDFMFANVNNIIGASAVVLVQELSSYPINPIIITGLIWFIYFTVASALAIFIYNSLRKEFDLFMDLGAFIYFKQEKWNITKH